MSTTARPWIFDADPAVSYGAETGGGQAAIFGADDQEVCCLFDENEQDNFPSYRENGALIVQAVNAFDTLLAVAKAASGLDLGVACEEECDHDECDLHRAILALDAHPGWREWTS